VFADPVFSAEDIRITPAHREPVTRPTLTAPGAALFRLPSTRSEAAAIAAAAPRGLVQTWLDFDASREAVLSPELRAFRTIHFATHAVFDGRRPDRSGIALSLVDQQGRKREGFLRLGDVYDMQIGAELVVLSACDTALGDELNGEGLMSLTRAFLHAGAARVVASLWAVDDKATRHLMQAFYTARLRGGLSAVAALREAQRVVQAVPRWRHPYYWAGFVVEGDWQ
jgi:CHAT domain-containing protein